MVAWFRAAAVACGVIVLLGASFCADGADIRDPAWDRTRRLAAIFGVPTEGLPVIETRTWSETARLSLQPLSQAERAELESLLDEFTGAMSHGFFDEADETAAGLKAKFAGRYSLDDFAESADGRRCRAAEPVYAFWPAFYRKLYRAISRALGGEHRRFVWPPRLAEIEDAKGGRQYLVQVDATGPVAAWKDVFAAGDASGQGRAYRKPASTLFLLFDGHSRLTARTPAISGPAEYSPLCADRPPRLWARRDLDGDGADEWLVTTVGRSFSVAGNEGEFLILGRKRLLFRHGGGLAPELTFLEDVTGDGLPDAVVRYPLCGAHTCGAEFLVVTAHGGGLRSLPGEEAGRRMWMAGDDVRLSGSRPPELVLSGGTIGSAGAGAQRSRTETWGWDGSGFVLKDTVWEKTDWRHHTVYDGDIAFRKGDLAGAAAAYERAVNDPALKDDAGWGDSLSSCRQYSAFRLVLLHLEGGRQEEGRTWRDWLAKTYPDVPLARAASLLCSEWEATGNLAAACGKVAALLAREDKPTGALEDRGYGNPSIKAADVCPVR